MQWQTITTIDELNKAIELSHSKPVLIFKHSTRCAVSSMAFDRLDRSWNAEEMKDVAAFMIDVIMHRPVSMAVQEKTGVWHESPQIILLVNGQVQFHESHMGIYYDSVKEALAGV